MSERRMEPETFTSNYVGTPGDRTFYIQARGPEGTLSFLIEKQQAALLADRLREMLMLIDQEDTLRSTEPGRDPALALDQPVEPEFRVGTIGLAYDEAADRVIVILRPDGDADEEGGGEEEDGVRLELRRDQVRAFVLHVVSVVAEGRPTCPLCGLPMDPEGHVCPASNGHRMGG